MLTWVFFFNEGFLCHVVLLYCKISIYHFQGFNICNLVLFGDFSLPDLNPQSACSQEQPKIGRMLTMKMKMIAYEKKLVET